MGIENIHSASPSPRRSGETTPGARAGEGKSPYLSHHDAVPFVDRVEPSVELSRVIADFQRLMQERSQSREARESEVRRIHQETLQVHRPQALLDAAQKILVPGI